MLGALSEPSLKVRVALLFRITVKAVMCLTGKKNSYFIVSDIDAARNNIAICRLLFPLSLLLGLHVMTYRICLESVIIGIVFMR